MSANLKRVIDRMVEDSIRRILPAVMNEVLVATIARGTAQVVSEERPVRGRKPPKKRKVVREQRIARQVSAKKPGSRKTDLSEILDESAGSEFYQDPRALYANDDRESEIMHEETDTDESPISQRIQTLPPELRSLAEGINLDDDGGEMWGNEHDSGAPATPTNDVRDIGSAARAAGIDFSRMKGLINATSPAKKVDRDDIKARAQFENARIKRMREQLNGGKPVE